MKMKKLVAVLAVVGMTGVMMAGCGSSSAAANTDSDAASQDQASDWDSSNDISIVSREDGSGTRGAFIELFGIEEKQGDQKVDMTTEDAQITNNTSVMLDVYKRQDETVLVYM